MELFHTFRRRYGDGEGRSEYPRWADDTESRELAIKTGDGYTLHRWETREISVVLFWSGPGDSMSVSYFHAALDERVRSAKSPMTRQR